MSKNGRIKLNALTLIEIIVSLAVFSFIFSIVIGISLMLVRAQTKIQAQIFLTQTAQTTIEDISRNLRFGYAYSGGDRANYMSSGYNIRLNNTKIIKTPVCVDKYDENGILIVGEKVCSNPENEVTDTPVIMDAADSPFIVFENKDGNPTTYIDQNTYCIGPRTDNTLTLYKLEKFTGLNSNGTYVEDFCKSTSESAQDMLPSDVKLNYASFDVYGQSAESPVNPMVRVKLKISSELGGEIMIQTTVTQRLRGNIL